VRPNPKIRRVTLFGVVVICLVSPGQAGSQRASAQDEPFIDQSHWMNLPNAPLVFEIARNKRFLSLINYSDETIQEYQLACVGGTAENFKLIREIPSRKIAIEGKNGTIVVAINNPLPSVRDGRKICKSGSFVVWRVQFEDGKTWTAK
jgi:hypothetical protein